HILFGGGLLGERPGQHEFGFKDGSRRLHGAVEGRHHPGDSRVPNPALEVGDVPAGVALVPSPVELLGGGPELYDEVPGEVLRLNLAPLLAPKADQSRLVAAHDNPGVRAADEGPTVG